MNPKGQSSTKRAVSGHRNHTPRNNLRKRPRKSLLEDEDSENSLSSDTSDETKTPAAEPEELAVKLPEELLRTFYKTPGVLLIAGQVSWDMVAKRDNNPANRTHPNLYVFHKFTERKYRFIASGCVAAHSVLISEAGEAYTFGRNNCGQLGLGDTVTRDTPTLVPELVGKNIIYAAVGRNHTLFVTDTGAVLACGDNKSGQCGIGSVKQTVLKPVKIKYAGAPIVKVGCGAEFSMILDCNGTLHSFGMPEYGQLGHNSDTSYFVSSSKISYHFQTKPKAICRFVEKTRCKNYVNIEDVEIVEFSCGTHHTVAIDSKKRAYSWGFGGFGRLGHAEQKDELMPRLIKYFDQQMRGVRSVHCGGSYSLAVNEHGLLYMFGQTKRTGEANMYPKPVQDLAGWNIRSIGTSSTSIMIAADDSLIAWGVSPTYGELGTGEINKSTTRPKEVTRMEAMNISQVTMGFSHTLLICDNTSEEVQKKLAEIPTFSP